MGDRDEEHRHARVQLFAGSMVMRIVSSVSPGEPTRNVV